MNLYLWISQYLLHNVCYKKYIFNSILSFLVYLIISHNSAPKSLRAWGINAISWTSYRNLCCPYWHLIQSFTRYQLLRLLLLHLCLHLSQHLLHPTQFGLFFLKNSVFFNCTFLFTCHKPICAKKINQN